MKNALAHGFIKPSPSSYAIFNQPYRGIIHPQTFLCNTCIMITFGESYDDNLQIINMSIGWSKVVFNTSNITYPMVDTQIGGHIAMVFQCLSMMEVPIVNLSFEGAAIR
jgi:hypothetical protein